MTATIPETTSVSPEEKQKKPRRGRPTRDRKSVV